MAQSAPVGYLPSTDNLPTAQTPRFTPALQPVVHKIESKIETGLEVEFEVA